MITGIIHRPEFVCSADFLCQLSCPNPHAEYDGAGDWMAVGRRDTIAEEVGARLGIIRRVDRANHTADCLGWRRRQHLGPKGVQKAKLDQRHLFSISGPP